MLTGTPVIGLNDSGGARIQVSMPDDRLHFQSFWGSEAQSVLHSTLSSCVSVRVHLMSEVCFGPCSSRHLEYHRAVNILEQDFCIESTYSSSKALQGNLLSAHERKTESPD